MPRSPQPPLLITARCRPLSGISWSLEPRISPADRSRDRRASGAASLSGATVYRDLAFLLRLLSRPQNLRSLEEATEAAVRPRRRPRRVPVDRLSDHLHAGPVRSGVARQAHAEPARADIWDGRRSRLQHWTRMARRFAPSKRLPVDVYHHGHSRIRASDRLAAQRRLVRELDAPLRARNAVRPLGNLLPARSDRRKSTGRIPARLARHGVVVLRFEHCTSRDYRAIRILGARATAVGRTVARGRSGARRPDGECGRYSNR